MFKSLTLSAFIVLFVLQPALAEEPRLLEWEDLLPEEEKDNAGERSNIQVIPLFEDQTGGDDYGAPGDEYDPYDPRGALAQGGTFNVVKELDGELVSLPGFIVPLDFESRDMVTGFLLVPYFGACIHYPPPPPNQTVYVTTEKPIRLKKLSQSYLLTGTLHTEANYNELGNAAYTMTLESWKEAD